MAKKEKLNAKKMPEIAEIEKVLDGLAKKDRTFMALIMIADSKAEKGKAMIALNGDKDKITQMLSETLVDGCESDETGPVYSCALAMAVSDSPKLLKMIEMSLPFIKLKGLLSSAMKKAA